MPFIDYVLEPPTYGWQNEKGELIKPNPKEIWAEFFRRVNIFHSKKNWLPFAGWFWVLCLLPFVYFFFAEYFTWPRFVLGLAYSLICMGTHGTIWYHRYSTHHAYKFTNNFWRFVTQHLVIKVMPEETYVVSHHVHHSKSDMPGDPYNASAGFLYCFLADTNHQPISRNLNEEDYKRVSELLKHTGMSRNSYEQYQKWASVSHPFKTIFEILMNWVFWATVFYFIGGPALVCTLFGCAFFWALGIRTFNYQGHGKGKDKRKHGVDFNTSDMSINEWRPGFLAGEWHNNHHLYPSSARAGFLPHQVDFAWYYIYFLYLIGGVSSYHDAKKSFKEKYYKPFKEKTLS